MYLFLCTCQSPDSFICLEGRVEPFQQTFYFSTNSLKDIKGREQSG